MLDQLQTALDNLQSRIKRMGTKNVNDKAIKEESVTFAKLYFSTLQPEASASPSFKDNVPALDSLFQDLVRLSNGNNARNTYIRVLGEIRKQFSSLHVALISELSNDLARSSNITPTEKKLIATLNQIIPSSSNCYQQGLSDLQMGNRFSYRGTVSEFREALREVLDHFAPDELVTTQPGFSLEQGRSKPTMKQKVRFILIKRNKSKTQRISSEKTIELIETLTGEIARAVYDRASLGTHVEASRTEAFQVKRYTDAILCDILEIT
jgi:hypothetical protein